MPRWRTGPAGKTRSRRNRVADVPRPHVAEHGSVASINYKTRVDGYKLGQWCTLQRQQKKRLPGNPRGILRPERARLLETVPGWSWEPRNEGWEIGFAHLARYAELHGHTRVPPKHVERGYPLGKWANMQRQQRRQGYGSPDRQARLEALPGWSWNPQVDRWEEGFRQLLRYVEQNGDAEPTFEFIQDGFLLGRWVGVQRTRLKEGRMRRDRQARLESVPGWVWKARRRPAKTDRDWDEYYATLQRFVAREGHARVPHTYVEEGRTLGSWVRAQRASFKNGSRQLTAERIARLESLPGWVWRVNPTDPPGWGEHFRCLEQFVQREGHPRVPGGHVEDGKKLGVWVSNQRADYRRGASWMTADRVKRLEALPGWTWGNQRRLTSLETWEKGFSRLQAYVERYGSARVPRSHVEDGHRLGQWVHEQRQLFARDGSMRIGPQHLPPCLNGGGVCAIKVSISRSQLPLNTGPLMANPPANPSIANSPEQRPSHVSGPRSGGASQSRPSFLD